MEVEEFSSFMKSTLANPELKHKDFMDFLILPVQRLPRYVLLLSSLSKYTNTPHPDAKNLIEAMNKLQEFLATTNDKKLQKDKMKDVIKRTKDTRVEEIMTENRVVIYEGLLRDHNAKKERYCFLFNDLILLSKPTKNPGKWTFSKEKYLKWTRILLDSSVKLTSLTPSSEKLKKLVIRRTTCIYISIANITYCIQVFCSHF